MIIQTSVRKAWMSHETAMAVNYHHIPNASSATPSKLPKTDPKYSKCMPTLPQSEIIHMHPENSFISKHSETDNISYPLPS